MRMLHLSGCKAPRDAFSVHPDLATSLAIHNAWLTLELPLEGLRGLHTHIHAQLMLSSPPVCLWDMCMLWGAFPHDSEIVKAMGLNFIEAYVNMEYMVQESREILAWLQSTPELRGFFKSLQDAVPVYKMSALEVIPAVEEKEKAIGTGYKTIGKKAGKAIKAAVIKEAAAQVGIMERGVTRKVSPRERQEREASDFEALRARLRRTRSDDSLRSVDTAIWDPQTLEGNGEKKGEDGSLVNNDMNDRSNYSGGTFSAALAKTLESIRLRREARKPKNKPSSPLPAEVRRTANLGRHSVENQPVCKSHLPRHRRSLSATTTGKEHGLSIADLERRIQVLKAKQHRLAEEAKKEAVNDGDSDFDSDSDSDDEEVPEGSVVTEREIRLTRVVSGVERPYQRYKETRPRLEKGKDY